MSCSAQTKRVASNDLTASKSYSKRDDITVISDEAHCHFLWRPFLPDADDDMVLELAFAAGSRYIVAHNVKDFHGSEELGVTAIRPRDFLNLIWSTS